MQLLESALAFAVVMILLSTIVTGIVEALLRLLRTREENLKSTIESLFETIIWPRLKTKLAASDGVTEMLSARRKFVDSMTLNPAATALTSDKAAKPAERPNRWFSRKDRVDALSVIAFAERLGRTAVGQAILTEADRAVEPLIKDFARSFERFGRASSEVFRTRAKQFAVLAGILLAFAANVEAGRLFNTLLSNPDLRTSLIEQADEALQANQQAALQLEQLSKQIDKGELGEKQSEQFKKKLEEIKGGIGALESQGLPIGYSYYPFCHRGADGDPACAASSDRVERAQKITRWVLLTIAAGVLMGLGGPFWFRVFSSLSQVFQLLRAVGVGSKPQQVNPEQIADDAEVEESVKPKSVLDAFLVSAKTHAESLAATDNAAGGAAQIANGQADQGQGQP